MVSPSRHQYARGHIGPTDGTHLDFCGQLRRSQDANGQLRSVLVLDPLFSYSADEFTYHWSLFDLLNCSGRKAGAPPTLSLLEEREAFDVWPFWFSRQTDTALDRMGDAGPITAVGVVAKALF